MSEHKATSANFSTIGRQCTVGGVLNESTGYACKMETLVSAWRTAFNATSEELPFGIVTLAGGSDEGQPYNMAAMRYAQTGNTTK